MKDINVSRSKSYISLKDGSGRMAGRRGFDVLPQSRTVQLSGKNWEWIWKRPSGVLIQQGEEKKHLPIIDFTRIIQILFYGLSFVFVGLGFINFLGKRRGEGYG